MDALQRLRDELAAPIIITSGHRCPSHNARVGGVSNSQHLSIAFDCACPAREQDRFVSAAYRAGFYGVGRYPSRNFVHLDLGPSRAW